MNEEEKKAIEIIESALLGLEDKNIVLNLIKKQQKEIDKKDKTIDKMAKELFYNYYDDLRSVKDIIEGFTKQVEGEKE